MDNQPSPQLFKIIMARLDRERGLLVLRRRLIIAHILLSICVVCAIPLLRTAMLEFSRSAFMQYLSLLLFDFKAVSAYWQDLALSMIESLPALSLAAPLGLITLVGTILRIIAHYQELITQAYRHQLTKANQSL
jgi:hypothetical protein